MMGKEVRRIIAMVFLGVFLLSVMSGCSYISAREVTATVKDKERIVKGDDSYYLVFTDKGVFQNSDITIRFKFRSSDLQGKLEKGKTYKFLICGWRIPIGSAYPNIIRAEEVR